MNWVTGILVYIIIWWLVFFITLPFGISAQENPAPGTVPSAPARPRLWLKAAVTTVAAALLSGVFWIIVQLDLISFRELPE